MVCPSWLTEFAVKRAESGIINSLFDYRWYMELVEQGYLKENGLLTVIALKDVIYERDRTTYDYRYTPQALAERDVTLKEHIWLLFKYESSINNSDRYQRFAAGSEPGRW